MATTTNWAGNVRFQASAVRRPATVAELQGLVSRSALVRALGTGHSFSHVADTGGELVSLSGLPARIEPDIHAGTVTVSAGLRFSDVAPVLTAAGLALANMASLPHISVAGAIATGTHGSGDSNQCLAAAVSALELVTADGDLLAVSRASNPDEFAGMVVALGACGIVTSVTLQAVPAFQVAQWVYDLPFGVITANFDDVMAAGYSVSVFTNWSDETAQVWVKRRVPAQAPSDGWLGAQPATGNRHPVPGLDAASATRQLGVPGPWFERLPHFRPEFVPSAGAELQSEYLVARHDATAALAVLDGLRAELAPVVQVSEIRTIAADDLWLSPSFGRDTVGLHFTWVSDFGAMAPVLATVESALAPLSPRPHWGKLSSLPGAQVAALYPRLDDFRALAGQLDPRAVFRNEYVSAYLDGRS